MEGMVSDTDRIIAWSVLTVGWALPLLHVALSPRSGPWRSPPGFGCPLGPRWGWVVLVLMTGAVGWLLMIARRRSPPRPADGRASEGPARGTGA